MAFSTNEKWGYGTSSSLDDEGNTTSGATRTIEGFSDSPTTDTEVSFRYILPPLGSIHPRLGLAYVLKNISIKQKTTVHFEATLSYETKPSEDPDNQTYPWNDPAIVDFTTLSESGETEYTPDDEPIVTVNDEPFTVNKDYADQGIQIKKAFLTYSPAAFYNYINSVNSDGFLGFPAGTLRVTGIEASSAIHEYITYYNVTVTIAARKPIATTNDKAWYWRGIQKGLQVLPDATATATVHARVGGSKASSPVMIKADGTQFKTGDTPHFLEIKIYDEQNFSGMGLF